MSRKRKRNSPKCPLCRKYYCHKRRISHHHIFCRYWYSINVTVEVCSQCHQKEFNRLYPMDLKGDPWSLSLCLHNWVEFCKIKGKNAFLIYPKLTKLEPLY